MKRKSGKVLFIYLTLSCVLLGNCTKSDIKSEASVNGDYSGTATNKANNSDKKTLSLTITSSANPIAGTYKLNGAAGKITGSILGLILNMSLKPDATGTTYTFAATAGDNDTSLTGTMTGVESSTTVIYDVVLKK